jgi:lambda repressor-like predicted transcriptional regulator
MINNNTGEIMIDVLDSEYLRARLSQYLADKMISIAILSKELGLSRPTVTNFYLHPNTKSELKTRQIINAFLKARGL